MKPDKRNDTYQLNFYLTDSLLLLHEGDNIWVGIVKIIAVYSENHQDLINALNWQKTDF